MANTVLVKGKSLIKKITKDLTEGSEYLTYIPGNGELVCVSDAGNQNVYVGDGTSHIADCDPANTPPEFTSGWRGIRFKDLTWAYKSGMHAFYAELPPAIYNNIILFQGSADYMNEEKTTLCKQYKFIGSDVVDLTTNYTYIVKNLYGTGLNVRDDSCLIKTSEETVTYVEGTSEYTLENEFTAIVNIKVGDEEIPTSNYSYDTSTHTITFSETLSDGDVLTVLGTIDSGVVNLQLSKEAFVTKNQNTIFNYLV